MTELVLVLCGAIVKTAFKLWSGGNAFADELSGDLTDLIKGQVSGALEQRKVRTRFEKMEEIVADQVIALLNAEFRNMDEGEKNAAILAVTETFERARLTDKALFAANLDPLYLTKTVRRFTSDATRDLSWAGTALYDRVLAQCCAYIIEIADKLPRFQAGAFAELLNRDEQIMARLAEVLERLPVPDQDGAGTADRVETAYRQRIAQRFDRLELFGLDFAAQWYSLSIAYVNLDVNVLTERKLGKRDDSFESWLAECPRLLIDGRAGGGKTTILQWIAVRAARRDFTGAAAQFNGYVPFFIRLREYAAEPLPQPESFLDRVAPLLAPENRAWPREQLRSGRAFVLIDGVDEVPEAKRAAVLAWLHELTELFPQVRYVVTTRPSAVDDGALADSGFDLAALHPMEPTLTRRFVDRWHAAMREWQKDVTAQEQLDNCRSRLAEIFDEDRFIRELANTPLLAGLICALNQHLGGQLPRRRGEIFEKALTMFYERDRKRGIVSGVTLDLAATDHLLGDLAVWMVRNALIQVNAPSATAALGRSARSLPNVAAEAPDLYRHLLLRSGLLREPTSGHVDFIHRAFQEYLAARALVAADNVGEIVKNAGDDQWREIVILATGTGNIRQVTDLLHGLVRKTWRGQGRYRRRMLAVASLDEIRGADPEVLAQVERAIPELLPPKSRDQAELLSRAGKRVLPHLARNIRFSDAQAIAPVIYAATLIGGAGALDLIAQVIQVNIGLIRDTGDEENPINSEVGDALEDMIDYFDPALLAEKVITYLELKRVYIDRTQRLPLATPPTIERVELSRFVRDNTDLSPLDRSQMRTLVLENCDISSLTGLLRPWPTVREVVLRYCPELLDISALNRLPNLARLEIEGCGQVTGEDIARLPRSVAVTRDA